MPRQGGPIQPTRSKKAGRPPESRPETPRVRRRQKTAQAALRKDTMLLQSAQDHPVSGPVYAGTLCALRDAASRSARPRSPRRPVTAPPVDREGGVSVWPSSFIARPASPGRSWPRPGR